ncbi:ROK family protein [Kribbella sp. NPDC051586]|uniref:ROK family transcriptional regulator n=1 Tax=Kribbella sp. NPDC051586 TaxID=3364118 RepID=UPI00378CEF82
MTAQQGDPVLVAAADRGATRRGNLGLILRLLRDHGARSQAKISQETGLPKATVSNLMSELVGRGLVSDSHVERGRAMGRPGQALDVDGTGICAIGAEINPAYLGVTAEALQGKQLYRRSVALNVEALDPSDTLDRLARMLRAALTAMRKDGQVVVGICVALPGVVDSEAGRSVFASGIGWSNIDVAGQLRAKLGADLPGLRVENDVRVSAVAEYAQVAAGFGVQDLVYVTGAAGVAVGIIANGRLIRGHAGHSGEIGHTSLDRSDRRQCACGRTGCWELSVGAGRFLELAAEADDTVRDPDRDLEERIGELRRRADNGDRRTLAAVAEVADSLGAGVAMLCDVLDPRVVVLGGYFSVFGDYFVNPVQQLLDAKAMAPSLPRTRVIGSAFGFDSTTRGAAANALESVYQDPTIVPLAAEA